MYWLLALLCQLYCPGAHLGGDGVGLVSLLSNLLGLSIDLQGKQAGVTPSPPSVLIS
jgi:hypothetical protein